MSKAGVFVTVIGKGDIIDAIGEDDRFVTVVESCWESNISGIIKVKSGDRVVRSEGVDYRIDFDTDIV